MSNLSCDRRVKLIPFLSGGLAIVAMISLGLAMALTPARAQLRAGVGCPGLKLDRMPPNMTEAELQCQCFSKCGAPTQNAPPPRPSPAPSQSSSFDMCSECWVKGDGYAKFRAQNLDGCRQTCRGDGNCLSFEFYAPQNMCNLFSVRMKIEPTRGPAMVGLRN